MNTRLVLVLTLVLTAGAAAQPKVLEAIKDESSVTYRLVHPLHEIEAVSKDVEYFVRIDPENKKIDTVSARVDVTTFDSGNSNRDSHAMEVIDAISFPDASFSSTAITQTGDSLSVAGRLTFHGITKDVVAAGSATWSQDKLNVRASFGVSLTEFQIDRPSLLMIPVNDTLTFSLVAAFGLK
jgi:polyisoprenoid-binding protein YceI